MENQPTPDASATSQTNEIIQHVIEELRIKAKENHRIANTYFFMVIAVIISGLAVFIFAYRFTSNFEIERSIQNSRQFLIKELNKRQPYHDSLMQMVFLKEKFVDSIGYLYKYDDTVDVKSPHFDRLRGSKLVKIFYDSLFTLSPYFLGGKNRLRNYSLSNSDIADQYYSELHADIVGGIKSTNYEIYNLINTSALRVGSVIIVLFLVQILIRVFRYNTRLANFYTARAQALELYSKDQTNLNFKDLVASLSPDNLDIGMSKNPSEQLLELAKLFSKN
jgi:hypothetical protein